MRRQGGGVAVRVEPEAIVESSVVWARIDSDGAKTLVFTNVDTEVWQGLTRLDHPQLAGVSLEQTKAVVPLPADPPAVGVTETLLSVEDLALWLADQGVTPDGLFVKEFRFRGSAPSFAVVPVNMAGAGWRRLGQAAPTQAAPTQVRVPKVEPEAMSQLESTPQPARRPAPNRQGEVVRLPLYRRPRARFGAVVLVTAMTLVSVGALWPLRLVASSSCPLPSEAQVAVEQLLDHRAAALVAADTQKLATLESEELLRADVARLDSNPPAWTTKYDVVVSEVSCGEEGVAVTAWISAQVDCPACSSQPAERHAQVFLSLDLGRIESFQPIE